MAKTCYGKYMMDVCEGHNQCKEIGCFNKTNQEHGDCDCKYKFCCNLGRQHIESLVRKTNKYGYNTVEQCDCYKLISERIEEMGKEDPVTGRIGVYAPGNYMCKCHDCGNQFMGDKRSLQCNPCALQMYRSREM